MPIEVLRRYARSASDEAERRRVDEWASGSLERQNYLAAIRNLLDRAQPESRARTGAAWTRLAARLDEGRVPTRARPSLGRFLSAHRGPRSAALLAAGALLAVLAGSVLLDRAAARRAEPNAGTVAMRVISTAVGQRADIRLSDGSRVALGVASRLRLPADFGERSRDLYLDGSAYFEVVHDSTRPFRVHTATAVMQDVGTRFVVTAYPGSASTQVVVADGAVTLRSPRDSSAHIVQLGAGNLARITRDGSPVVVRAVDPAQYMAWMDGRLIFHDTPLSDVVAELHRWYDEDVRIGDSTMARLPLSASFDVESFSQSVQVITTVLPLRAVTRDGVVTLYRR
jgi:transmembrane sensor